MDKIFQMRKVVSDIDHLEKINDSFRSYNRAAKQQLDQAKSPYDYAEIRNVQEEVQCHFCREIKEDDHNILTLVGPFRSVSEYLQEMLGQISDRACRSSGINFNIGLSDRDWFIMTRGSRSQYSQTENLCFDAWRSSTGRNPISEWLSAWGTSGTYQSRSEEGRFSKKCNGAKK
ncbi:MAG: hypothetical protein IPK04_11465 [Bdellovibrionales bacterium]|nr:hypothetical protein [Bdellovibrionales bacterium]